MADLVYKHVLLKVSGEMLGGDAGQGISTEELGRFADEIKEVRDSASRWPSSSAAGTSSAGSPAPRTEWTAPPPITWACSPP